MERADKEKYDSGFMNSETPAAFNFQGISDAELLQNDDPFMDTALIDREKPDDQDTPLKTAPDLNAEVDSFLKKCTIEDTEIFDGDEMVMEKSHKADKNIMDYSYHDKNASKSPEKTPSIMDLLNKHDTTDSLIDTDADIQAGGDITSRIDGKTLDELLKTSIKDEDDWHKSKNKSVIEKKKEERKKKEKKLRRLQITMIVAIVVILIAAFVVNFLIKSPEQSEENQQALPISFNKIEIPPNLKDKSKLNCFYNIGKNLYKKKKYQKASRIFEKLLKTGWNTGLLYGMLGNCKYNLKDEEAAKKYYQQSAATGYIENIEFALNLAKILTKEENYSEVIKVLQPFKEKFDSNRQMHLLLATAYDKTDDRKNALICYKKINPGMLPENQLSNYAQLLEKSGDKDGAFKLYLMLGKLYSRSSAYTKAEQLAPDKETKLSILAQIVAKTAGTPQGNYYKMRLGITMIDLGKIKEGVEILKSVNTNRLKKTDATKYLMMTPYFHNEPILTKETIIILHKYYADDLNMHTHIMDMIKKSANPEFATDFFKQEYQLYPKNAIANYIYAETVQNNRLKKELYKNTLKISPDFDRAMLALAKLYMNEQNTKEAFKLLRQCCKNNPFDKKSQLYMTIVKIRTTLTSKAIKNYEKFLKKIKTPKIELLKEMVLISEYMPSDKYAIIYLKQAEKEPALKDFCRKENIKIKLIYKTITEKDFNKPIPSDIEKYYIIYLLGKGDYTKVMNRPLDKNSAAAFWKVFIRWKQGLPSWKQKAYRLIDKKNPVITSTIIQLWLKRISLSDAEAKLSTLPYIDQPLLALIIAEQYRKKGETFKSKVFFRKSLTYPNPNIYKQLSDYIRKH